MRGITTTIFAVMGFAVASSLDASTSPGPTEATQLPDAAAEALPTAYHDMTMRNEEAATTSGHSIELRRLWASESPKPIPRPRGFPALLTSLSLLGHAGLHAVKDYDTRAVPRPAISLLLGKARFDTANLALFSLLGGLALLYLGIKRRWRSHKERNLWRLDELLRQDRARVEAIRNGARRKL
ncbi:hypothetical protein, conserved [Eimeria necatrix]|uniref:Transmembrane protein n=1 Tax=Eimeria necatrix TaxID=51315 RepID=U6N145_9EIME|nr:hypothetical protein, conserved [Eimeria necatrix]CDJ69947.1 hypothetical protein, conserved [Eimeria necatrix]